MQSKPLQPPATTALDLLRRRFPNASMQTLKRMVSAGRVRVGGKRVTRLRQAVEAGEALEVDERPARATEPRRPIAPSLDPLSLIHEDEDVLVVVKPPGLLTSTVPRERRATALAIVRQYLAASDARARVGLIHRLDRDAAGLLVFSKNRSAYESLKRQFFHHTVERVYEAEVIGRVKPRKGRIESRLVEWPDGSVHSTHAPGKGQVAITDYAVIQQQKATALLRVTLLTGRKHQIRAHLSERGWPIIGDRIYGKAGRGGSSRPADTLRLVAVALAFDHPRNGQRVRFSIPGLAQSAAGEPARRG